MSFENVFGTEHVSSRRSFHEHRGCHCRRWRSWFRSRAYCGLILCLSICEPVSGVLSRCHQDSSIGGWGEEEPTRLLLLGRGQSDLKWRLRPAGPRGSRQRRGGTWSRSSCELSCFPFPSPPENLLLGFQALCVTETRLQASIVHTVGPKMPLPLTSMWASSTPDVLGAQPLVNTVWEGLWLCQCYCVELCWTHCRVSATG